MMDSIIRRNSVEDPRPNPTQVLADIEACCSSSLRIDSHFLKMAESTPDAAAISDGELTLTYCELARISGGLAGQLCELVDCASPVVAIYGRRSIGLVVSILAAVRAGFTFAVFDAAYPIQRLARQAGIISPSVIVGAGVSLDEAQAYSNSLNVPNVIVEAKIFARLGNLSEPSARLPSRIAYFLFTSGTTGIPKCIKTRHAPLIHFVDFYKNAFQPSPADRISMLSGIAHDPFLRDLFLPLSVGAQICIPGESVIRNPIKLYAWLQDRKISIIHATPQILRLICAGRASHQQLGHLRYVFSGGDRILSTHIVPLRRAAPFAAIVNFYGATETPQAMGFHVLSSVSGSDERIPLGRGISDVQLLVLTETLELARLHEPGQVAIRTKFLSDGYLNDDAATLRKFIISPFTLDPADQIYLTGDLGYFQSDGSVVGVGRMDDQVKIRGFRVELTEVEHAIASTGTATDAAVLAQSASNGESELVAYLVASDQSHALIGESRTEQVRRCLLPQLPGHMIPSHFVWIDRMPLSPNGKVDRQKLISYRLSVEEPEEGGADSGGAPLTILIRDWRKILAQPALDSSKSFVQLGGDSLSYIQASLSVEETLGWLPNDWENIPLVSLAELPRRNSATSHQIGTPILVRAVSIFLIVLGHLGPIDITGTPTAFFVVAGWSFGKYQYWTIQNRQSIAPIFGTLAQVVLPVILYTLLLQLIFAKYNWQSLLLVTNFVSPKFAGGLAYWFIELLVQMYLVLALILSVAPFRRIIEAKPFQRVVALGVFFFALSIVSELFWNTDSLYHRVPQYYMWTLFLGIAIVFADGMKKKMVLTIFIAAAALAGKFPLFAVLATMLVLWVRMVPLPKHLVRPINYVAIASMFIYLTHYQFRSLIRQTPFGESTALTIVFALVGGVVVWKCWDLLVNFCIVRITDSSVPDKLRNLKIRLR